MQIVLPPSRNIHHQFKQQFIQREHARNMAMASGNQQFHSRPHYMAKFIISARAIILSLCALRVKPGEENHENTHKIYGHTATHSHTVLTSSNKHANQTEIQNCILEWCFMLLPFRVENVKLDRFEAF